MVKKSEVLVPLYAVPEQVRIELQRKLDTCDIGFIRHGEYTLTETVTPAHYNTISPITFTVNADHTITWETERREDILTSLSGDKKVGEITFSVDKTAGTLTTNVINNIGTTLPGTGGIGTTIFYVIGGGLMVAAAILLITKKRMENR